MSYYTNTQPSTGITNANFVQTQVLWSYLSDPTVAARQYPYSGTTSENGLQVTYYGYALPGASESSNVWRIRKYIISGSTAYNMYPNGDNLFNYSWTSKSGYTYA